jgi:guanosine-3',5'-bis(diphosphate) 3'-pyrophosphohydrolase
MEPEIYQKIKTEIAERKGTQERFIQDVRALLEAKLKEVGIAATVEGRHKHFYSIYKKMVAQELNVNQVYDIMAFRVIVDSIRECYEILGHIHSMWKPVPGRFKDYISVPKENMYQSLHTTMIGPLGQRMEVQIRTGDMHRVAEEGIAAHWKYKEGLGSRQTDEKQFAWLRQLLEWQKSLSDPLEFLESVRMDLFPHEVYVFTPNGEVREFPKGATPIDFAYSIHSEVGNKCMGAKVNGKMVPLRYELNNGDIVEIITSSRHHPSKDWLEYVKTPKARNKIRHWIKTQERDESIALGKNILERLLESEHVTFQNILKSDQVISIANDLSFHSVEDLLAGIGFGKVSPKQVVGRLKPKLGIKDEKAPGLVGKMVHRIKHRKTGKGIQVKGVSDMLIRFANCCHPLPGEEVIGFITRGRGVTIHSKKCPHVMKANRDRLVEVAWEAEKDSAYQAELKVTSVDKKGTLADITGILAQKDANIIRAEIKTTVDRKGVLIFTIEVTDYRQLQEIMGAIKRIKNVIQVERI